MFSILRLAEKFLRALPGGNSLASVMLTVRVRNGCDEAENSLGSDVVGWTNEGRVCVRSRFPSIFTRLVGLARLVLHDHNHCAVPHRGTNVDGQLESKIPKS